MPLAAEAAIALPIPASMAGEFWLTVMGGYVRLSASVGVRGGWPRCGRDLDATIPAEWSAKPTTAPTT